MKLLVVLFCLPYLTCLAGDAPAIAALKAAAAVSEQRQVRLETAAKAYLQKASTPEIDAKWDKAWAERLSSPEADQEGEVLYTQRVVRTFFEDHKTLIEDPDKINAQHIQQACRYFLLCRKKGIPIPGRLEVRLTDEVTTTIITFLEKQTNGANGQPVAAPTTN